MLSPAAQEDLREFYSVYNPDKIEMVPTIIAQANKKGMSAPDIFNSLYTKYNIRRLPTRLNIMLAMKREQPSADDELILSIIRNLEFKQGTPEDASSMLTARLSEIRKEQLAERERQEREAQEEHRRQQEAIRLQQAEQEKYLRAIEDEARRQREKEESEQQTPTVADDEDYPTLSYPTAVPSGQTPSPSPARDMVTAQPRPHPTHTSPPSRSSAPEATDEPFGARRKPIAPMPCKQTAELVMREELREWLVGMVGDYFSFSAAAGGLLNGGHRLQSEANVCDSLRDGAVLAVLQQRLRKPNIAAEDIRKPRTVGFFGRENTSIFINFCRKEFEMRDEMLFTDSDLCDAKNDRLAVNCLLAVAAIVYRRAVDDATIRDRAAKGSLERYGHTNATGLNIAAASTSSPLVAQQQLQSSSTPIRAAPRIVVYEDEIRKQSAQTSADTVEAAVRKALEEEQAESASSSAATHGASDTTTSTPTPQRASASAEASPARSDDVSPPRDLLVALQRQREALERQRAADIATEKRRAEIEALEHQRWEAARKAAQEQQDFAIRRERERQLFEVIEMKRQWIRNQMMFLEQQSQRDREGLEIAEEHGRYRLQEQIRRETRYAVDRTPNSVMFPTNIPQYKVINANGGIHAPSPSRHYVSMKGDPIDRKVARAVNRVFGKHTYADTRIKRLTNSGEYVVFHKITGKRTVVYVRDVRENLMIRVGGGWDDFEGWLERHVNVGLEDRVAPCAPRRK